MQRRKITGSLVPNKRPENPRQGQTDSVTNSAKQPDWIDEAATVFSSVVMPGQRAADETSLAAEAALIAAHIPYHLELFPIADEPQVSVGPTHEWRLLVPGKLTYVQPVS